MKYPGKDIRVAVYNLLAANLLYQGNPLYVWDTFVNPGSGFPRVVINSPEGSQDGSKSQNMWDLTMNIKITSAFDGDVATSNVVDEIADNICNLLMPTPQGPYPDASPNFNIWLINVLGDVNQEYEIARKKYIDKNLRINIKIEEL